MDTVPRCVCFSRERNSGGKWRGGLESVELGEDEEMYDQIDSPPVPVAVGSPACAKKSFDTVYNANVSENDSFVFIYKKKKGTTVKECVEVVVVYFA